MISASILFVLILSNTVHAQNPLKQFAEEAASINELVSSIFGLISNIIKAVTSFPKKPDLISLFTTLAAVNNLTNSSSCIQDEQNNFVNLLNNASVTIEQCFNYYGNNTKTTFNLVAEFAEIISNATEGTTTCLQSSNSLFEIPTCFATPVVNITETVNQLTTTVQATVNIVGSTFNHTSICMQNIVSESLTQFFIIIKTFTSCFNEII